MNNTGRVRCYKPDLKIPCKNCDSQGWRVNGHEFMNEGVIYRDENVKVEAFPVPNGSWPNSWGFSFITPDKVIVVSSDTKP